MKLSRKKLRKMILSEIKNITESQIYPGSGLSHGFSEMELAKIIFRAIDNNESEENLHKLRDHGIKKEAKLLHKLSQTPDEYEQGNIRQTIMLLNQSLDALDHHLGLYKHGRIADEDSHLGQYGLSPEGYPLERRYRRRSADMGHEARRPDDSDKLYDPNSPRYL